MMSMDHTTSQSNQLPEAVHGEIQARFKLPIHHDGFAQLSNHPFGRLHPIDWDALHAFNLVEKVERLLRVGV